MGKPKIRPPTAPKFSTDLSETQNQEGDSRDTILRAKFGGCGMMGSGSAKIANFGLLLVLFFVLFASRPDHTVGPITTNEGSKRVFLRKEVPFGGLHDKK